MNGFFLLFFDELFYMVLVLFLTRVVRKMTVLVSDGNGSYLVNGSNRAVNDLIILKGFSLVELDVIQGNTGRISNRSGRVKTGRSISLLRVPPGTRVALLIGEFTLVVGTCS